MKVGDIYSNMSSSSQGLPLKAKLIKLQNRWGRKEYKRGHKSKKGTKGNGGETENRNERDKENKRTEENFPLKSAGI